MNETKQCDVEKLQQLTENMSAENTALKQELQVC